MLDRRVSVVLALAGAFCAGLTAGCGGGGGVSLDASRATTKNVTVQINGVDVPVTRRGNSDSWKFVIARSKLNKNGTIAWKLAECTGVAAGDIAGVVQFYPSGKMGYRFQLMAG